MATIWTLYINLETFYNFLENFPMLWNFLKKGWCSQVKYINFRQKKCEGFVKNCNIYIKIGVCLDTTIP